MSMAMEEASARVPLHASFMLCANSLRYEAKLCDIILFVKGKLGAMVGYPAHKLLLISSSKYFKLLFEREDLRTHCHFPHLSEEGVFTVLDLIYGREININAQLDEALTAAKFLQVDYAVDQLEMICRESSVSSPKQTHSSSDIETPVKRTGEFISLSEISTKGSSVETSTSSPQQSQLEDFSDSSLLPNSRIKEAQTTNYDRLNIKTEPQSIVDLRTSMGGFLQSERIVSDVFSNDPTYYHNEPRHSDRLPQVTDNSPPQNLENASHLEGDRTRASLNTLYPYHLSTNNPDCSERAQFNLADHSEPAMYEMNRGMKLQIQDRSQTNKRVKREDGVGPHTSDYRVKQEEMKEHPFRCKVCLKVFKDGHNLRSHKIIHTDKDRFQCTVCGRKFYKSGNLKAHMYTHTEEKPHCCAFCGKGFVRSHLAKSHASNCLYRPGFINEPKE